MYAVLGTQDIAYTVQVLSKFSKDPGEIHWQVIKQVFQYFKDIQNLWLIYGGVREKLVGFTDIDRNMAEVSESQLQVRIKPTTLYQH